MPSVLNVVVFTAPLWGGFLIALVNFLKKE